MYDEEGFYGCLFFLFVLFLSEVKRWLLLFVRWIRVRSSLIMMVEVISVFMVWLILVLVGRVLVMSVVVSGVDSSFVMMDVVRKLSFLMVLSLLLLSMNMVVLVKVFSMVLGLMFGSNDSVFMFVMVRVVVELVEMGLVIGFFVVSFRVGLFVWLVVGRCWV